tara:strand:- start:12 stop:410 length:399 start_codon:yes stop_codon:yes gene_type:complete
MLFLALFLVGVSAYVLKPKGKRASSDSELVPKIKDPYLPVETGYKELLLRRLPQFSYNRGAIIGDVSPLNPIPYVSVIKERRDKNFTQWGSVAHDAKRQLALINDKFNMDEHPRLTSTFKIPYGKKRNSKHI